MSNPQPAKVALARSPSLPLRWLRSSLLSDFKCPKIGSIADRHFMLSCIQRHTNYPFKARYAFCFSIVVFQRHQSVC